MNLFQRAKDWLPARMQAAAGVGPVTYTRFADSSELVLEPWVGRHAIADSPEGATRVTWGDRDYLVRVSELVDAGGDPFMPAVGDRLAEVINGVETVFEVSRPDGGGEHFEWANAERTMIRLHVKRA